MIDTCMIDAQANKSERLKMLAMYQAMIEAGISINGANTMVKSSGLYKLRNLHGRISK